MRQWVMNVLAAVLIVAPVAYGQAPFSISATASCTVLYAELDALLGASGAYSLRVESRAGEYRELRDELAGRQPQAVPYVDEDLSQLPLVEVTGLRPTTRTVTRREPAPMVLEGVLGLGLGALLIYSGIEAGDSDDAALSYVLGALLLAGSVMMFTNERTVREDVIDQEAVRSNARIRSEAEAQNRDIRAENTERRQKRAERERIAAENEEIARERSRLDALLTRYERESQAMYESTVVALAGEGSTRCLDALVTAGALLQLDEPNANLYLVMRPLNRDGAVLPDANTLSGLDFTVTRALLSEPLGTLGRIEEPIRATLFRPEGMPAMRDAVGDGYLLRVPMRLSTEVVERDRIVAETEVVAEQDGRTVTERSRRHVQVID